MSESQKGLHRMRFTVDSYHGLVPTLVCLGHAAEDCGPRTVFDWDAVGAMENYRGDEVVLADMPIEVIESSEDGMYWVREESAQAARKVGQAAHQVWGGLLHEGVSFGMSGLQVSMDTCLAPTPPTLDELSAGASDVGPGQDSDTHWANGMRRLLTPEAYERMRRDRDGS